MAGNLRRSATIALGDPDDYHFLRAKNWSLGNIPNWRSMSNNTIYADSYDHISRELWENGYEVGADGKAKGEPYGFFNLPLTQKYGRIKDGVMKDNKMYPVGKDSATGTNPCQPAWAPLLTKKGITQLKDAQIGDEIWSSEGWTKIINKWSTGVKPVYCYRTTAGAFFGTDNHRVLSQGEKYEVGEGYS